MWPRGVWRERAGAGPRGWSPAAHQAWPLPARDPRTGGGALRSLRQEAGSPEDEGPRIQKPRVTATAVSGLGLTQPPSPSGRPVVPWEHRDCPQPAA